MSVYNLGTSNLPVLTRTNALDIDNDSAETALDKVILQPNTLPAGATIEWEMHVRVKTKSAPVGDLVLRVYVHDTLVETITLSPAADLNLVHAIFRGAVQVRTVGAAGTVVHSYESRSGTASLNVNPVVGSAPVTVDFTANATDLSGAGTYVSIDWVTADVSNEVHVEQYRVRIWT